MTTRSTRAITRERNAVAIAQNEVLLELHAAIKKFPPMLSPHEGYAIILEELDELWEQVRMPQPQSKALMRDEAKQVAAMALRFMADLT